jgi:crotonobetainyl-CoA:carnitine CoA-transferase CaiB-like acyl-CoA transferase
MPIMRGQDRKEAIVPEAEATAVEPPLAGLRVLDLSRILAGPTCTQLLADLGAEVIKIERPGRGDDTRGWGPPFLHDREGRETAESAYFLCANRGKASVAVDMTHSEGQAILRELAQRSDVLVENFKRGALARYGLDHATLARANPRLISCSITGFGQTGPLADRPGYDFLIQGMGGIMSLTGDADGPPIKCGVGIADVMCGMYAATAVLAALQSRARTGLGQHIDLALFDTQIAWLINQGVGYLTDGIVPPRRGNEHPTIVPYGTFPAADGDFILAVGNDAQFGRFCAVAGCDQIAEDPAFASNAARVRNRDTLIPRLRAVTVTRPAAAWIAALEAAGVPCGPVHDLAQVFDHPQTRARDMVLRLPHPLAGTVDLIANPIRFSGTPLARTAAPPLLGADTDAVLGRILGRGADEIARLRAAGAVA